MMDMVFGVLIKILKYKEKNNYIYIMKNLIVCRILSEINPIKYKHIRICMCSSYICSQNNLKLKQIPSNDYIPYIVCKIKKESDPKQYMLSHNCNCKTICKSK